MKDPEYDVHLKINPAIVAYTVLAIFIVMAFFGQGLLMHRINVKDNDTRCSIVGLVLKLTENGERTAKATLESHTASAAQKQAASTNLAQISATKVTTENLLKHPHGESCQEPQ